MFGNVLFDGIFATYPKYLLSFGDCCDEFAKFAPYFVPKVFGSLEKVRVAIIDYNAGNVRSVENAVRRLGAEPFLTSDAREIRSADKVIFPGVGEASTTMAHLQQTGLDEVIRSLRQPVLGICLGMQLLCAHSQEGDVPCLGILPETVLRFQPQRHEDKIPHMGWDALEKISGNLAEWTEENAYVYFVHSYYVPESPYAVALCDYVNPFTAAFQRDNFFAVQFHPEKSFKVGERILKGFLEL